MLNAKIASHLSSEGAHVAAHGWHDGAANVLACAPESRHVPPVHQDMPVSQVMTASVVSFAADTSIEEATQVLLTRGISGAPVVDAALRPTGMVSKTDLLEAWQTRALLRAQRASVALADGHGNTDADANGPHDAGEADDQVHVGDIMVPYLLAISHRAPICLATALMAYEGVQRLVVLGENNKMVGLVTSRDIVRWVAQLSGYDVPRATRLRRA